MRWFKFWTHVDHLKWFFLIILNFQQNPAFHQLFSFDRLSRNQKSHLVQRYPCNKAFYIYNQQSPITVMFIIPAVVVSLHIYAQLNEILTNLSSFFDLYNSIKFNWMEQDCMWNLLVVIYRPEAFIRSASSRRSSFKII